jgi:hypothetical protein
MRRKGVDLEGGGGLIEELLKMYGTRDGFSGKSPQTLRTEDGRIITFGSAVNIGDEQSFQGRARDFLGVDEAAQFAESQIRFLLGWIRSEDPGQRTRAVLASNPPLDAEGLWMVQMFRPWLDPTHHNPAEPGELRWFCRTPDGAEIEVEDGTPRDYNGDVYLPVSRSFIPASLSDNPFLRDTNYKARLDAMPEPLRSAMRDGNFMLAREDAEWQIIPTQWVLEAQDRWTEAPPDHCPMSAIGVDVAQGGADQTVLSIRHDGWFAPLMAIPGVETPDGPSVAGRVIAAVRNKAKVIVDMGGGWGGSTYDHLKGAGHPGVWFQAGGEHGQADQGQHARLLQRQGAGMVAVPRSSGPVAAGRQPDCAAPGPGGGGRPDGADIRHEDRQDQGRVERGSQEAAGPFTGQRVTPSSWRGTMARSSKRMAAGGASTAKSTELVERRLPKW